jgi:hypothetical protein
MVQSVTHEKLSIFSIIYNVAFGERIYFCSIQVERNFFKVSVFLAKILNNWSGFCIVEINIE